MDRIKDLLLEKRRYGLKEVISKRELKLLEAGLPIQKIIGYIEMANVKIELDKFVLIPRYETEELIYLVLEHLKKNQNVLDLCCGSGFIGIGLKKNFPRINITLSDISDDAVEQTKINLKVNRLRGHVVKSNLFKMLRKDYYDVIVSNPPYLMLTEEVSNSVTEFEPKAALFAADDGLFFYKQILRHCFKYLKSNGELWLEINPLHIEFWESIKNEYNLTIYNDIANLPRFVRIVKDENSLLTSQKLIRIFNQKEKMKKNIENKFIASMKSIALDAINKSGQGHIGMAIGAAPITYSLIGKKLNFTAQDPKWINRDRFVLSAGHGSMSFYSILHFLGLLSKDDIMSHKKIHSKTPSHPEIDNNEFVDASTGPLGQGVAMAVGMAISEKYLSTTYNKPEMEIINHHIYALHGDGCIQEGVALEAIQLAGTLKLNKLVLIHDFNNVQIDSRADEVNGVNLIEFFKSQNFNTFIANTKDPKSIDRALSEAKLSDKPSYIQVTSIIAEGTPNQNTSLGHNGTLKPDQTIAFKESLGLTNLKPFEYDDDVYDYGLELWEPKNKNYSEWSELYEKYRKVNPKEASDLEKIISNQQTFDLSGVEFGETNVATRNYIGTIMKYLEQNYKTGFLGGSADLFAATKVGFSEQFYNGGHNIRFGIREFSMAAINNGIYLHSNIRTLDSTFLVFADYMKAALRLGSMMEIPSIHVYTHDTYQVGGDGPTHQPFDQLPMLRAMHNFEVVRPCDESEMLAAFQYAFDMKDKQVAIIACRQPLKSLNLIPQRTKLVSAYVVKNEVNYDVSILASGSEVQLSLEVAEELKKQNIKAQVISVPHLQGLVNDENLILSLGLNLKPIYAIEATSDSMWFRLAKFNKFDAWLAKGFGWSDDGQLVYELKGFNKSNLSGKIIDLLK